jgi:8-hydroxy-5-deazaflavin:NADPH oxidoreductase
MRIGVLGTGAVGRSLAAEIIDVGHEVRMGARDAGNETAMAWANEAGESASSGSFADAASFAEMVVNATAGAHSVEALAAAGAENLAGKVLLDVANPLDFSAGMPPTLAVCNTDSLGEQIQRAFPEARVVKALNTMNAEVLVDPHLVRGSHTAFLCGDDRRQAPAARPPPELRLAGGGRHGSRGHHGGAGHGDVPAAVAAALRRRPDRLPQRQGGGAPALAGEARDLHRHQPRRRRCSSSSGVRSE